MLTVMSEFAYPNNQAVSTTVLAAEAVRIRQPTARSYEKQQVTAAFVYSSSAGRGRHGGCRRRHGVAYDTTNRTVQLTLREPAQVVVEAWWATSFTPPEPTSTSMRVIDSHFDSGEYFIPLPAEVPPVASFVTVSVGPAVRAFTVGAMPEAVLRMVPTGDPTQPPALPPVRAVATHSDD
jgi:hypothetical protein